MKFTDCGLVRNRSARGLNWLTEIFLRIEFYKYLGLFWAILLSNARRIGTGVKELSREIKGFKYQSENS